MTWYKTGTISVTNGSPTVTLSGGDAQLNIFPDDGFVGPDGRTYAILQVNNATTFILSQNYAGPTISGQNYVIIPTADHVQLRDMLIGVNQLVDNYGNMNAGRFESGTALQPGVRGLDHDGTGLVWNNDGTLSISVNGVSVITFDNGMVFGGVQSVTDGAGVDVDNTDAANPIINLDSASIASLGLADTAVQPSIFTASQQILISSAASTPAVTVAVPTNSLVGRAASGDIKGMSAAEAKVAIGLNNVANLAPADLPVSNATLTALAGKADLVGGVIPTAQIPAIALTEVFTVSSQAAMLALTAQTGDFAIRSDVSKTFVLSAMPASTLGNWVELAVPGGGVASVNGQTGIVVLGKADVGLGNVDNTSDANKPVSTAQQTALNGKISTSIFTAAQQILFSTGANTPATSVAVGVNSLIGRAASGNIKGLSAAEATTALGVSGSIVGTTSTQTLTNKTLTSPTIDGYTEGSATATGSAFSPNLAADTLFYYTTSGNATITLPTPAVGKSFTIVVNYGGAHTLSWAGGARKWSGGTVPTNTSVSGKEDIFSFVCVDGTNWLAAQSGKNY